ncbi:Hypothetical predicted protein [Cloeon dipterum]|uniref:Uncharacterized protein n=1 Tax=Cloeon dipterum TaxID=197152 RepID=A0A8S1E7W2_9INSE|nr:Hypothetical predicted protein [Cloeon dipterum]
MAPKKCVGRQSRKSWRKFSVKHQAAAERAVSYMIHTDNLTINTVEKKGFKRLAQTLSQGQFECKSRRTFGRMREKTVQDLKSALAEKIRNAGYFSLTTDACTLTKPKKSYLVVTGHILDAFFNRSPATSNMLKEVQQENGVEEKSQLLLVTSCETRWNNTCDMVERYRHVTEVMEKLGNPHELPDEEKLAELEDCFSLLKPCREVTELLSGSTYPTSSIAIPTCKNLQYALTALVPSTLTGGQFKENLLRNLNKYLEKIYSNKILIKSMMLDPRFLRTYLQPREASIILTELEEDMTIIENADAISDSTINLPLPEKN